jgi:hypothetical protein
MTPQIGTVIAPTGDVYLRKALLDKGSRCVNEVNVVYQTVYKPQYTPYGDNRADFVAALYREISFQGQNRAGSKAHKKLEALTATRPNSLSAKRNFCRLRNHKFSADVFIVNKCQPVRRSPRLFAPVGDNKTGWPPQPCSTPRMGTLAQFCRNDATKRPFREP